MGAQKKISDLLPGQTATVEHFATSEPWVWRLQELGLLPGALVQLIRCAPLGDPFEIEVKGSLLSLRKKEASAIWVSLA
tara:strand:- start:63829 stop:64065 length:237 start_codon:yes stop_codon:yes gene_type:complete